MREGGKRQTDWKKEISGWEGARGVSGLEGEGGEWPGDLLPPFQGLFEGQKELSGTLPRSPRQGPSTGSWSQGTPEASGDLCHLPGPELRGSLPLGGALQLLDTQLILQERVPAMSPPGRSARPITLPLLQ